MNRSLKRFALKLSLLSKEDFVRVVANGMASFPNSAKERLLSKVMASAMPKEKYRKVESYLEKLFEKNMTLKPLIAASMCMKYLRINPTMKPLLIMTARKVKDKQRKRKGVLFNRTC